MAEQEDRDAPKCDLKWEGDHFIVECETPEDRDLAVKALEDKDIVVKVKVKKENQE